MIRRKTLYSTAIVAALAAGGAMAAHITEIGQKGKVFSLEEISIPAGSVIRVVNDDNVLHSLILNTPDGQRTNLGTEKPGEHMDITIAQVGEYTARCGIHPAMKLVVHAR